ncbi:MAG: putative toxin-antitoxin system toxin component, PIN family [Cytophagales bacterium]|jgi:putative PIN family toxin of toxin-antitoxin system|nr:putative toxin-antitoxin system toxin component, PIN family [Cytophagales bacterium]
MQRIVIDTNVFVSALIQKSYPYHIVNHLFLANKVSLCISDSVFEEYCAVFGRKKFSRFPDFYESAQKIISDIESKSIRYTPTKKIAIISDHDDNKFLELALECKAHFLITGNTNDFTIKSFKRTAIVTPKEYWDSFSS